MLLMGETVQFAATASSDSCDTWSTPLWIYTSCFIYKTVALDAIGDEEVYREMVTSKPNEDTSSIILS